MLDSSSYRNSGKSIKQLLIFLICILFFNCDTTPEFQNGDIIFQTSRSSQSKALQQATHSKYSHMGIIYVRNNKQYVYEAVQPVKLTLLKSWINRGENKQYVVKRLKDHEKVLTPDVIERMLHCGEKYKGKDYDKYFEWSDERIYCSELVWKIYKEAVDIEIGQLQRMGDFDLSHPLVKNLIEERYGDHPPMDEIVISPESMFQSEELYTVYSN